MVEQELQADSAGTRSTYHKQVLRIPRRLPVQAAKKLKKKKKSTCRYKHQVHFQYHGLHLNRLVQSLEPLSNQNNWKWLSSVENQDYLLFSLPPNFLFTPSEQLLYCTFFCISLYTTRAPLSCYLLPLVLSSTNIHTIYCNTPDSTTCLNHCFFSFALKYLLQLFTCVCRFVFTLTLGVIEVAHFPSTARDM